MSIPYGAKVFEKHFLPNFRIKNVGDYKLSLNPDEMKKYINDVTKSFMALGKVRKTFFLPKGLFKFSEKISLF